MTKSRTPKSQTRRLPPQEHERRRRGVVVPAILTLAGAAVALWVVENQTGAVSRTARRARGAAGEFWDHAGERAHHLYDDASGRMHDLSREARHWGEKAHQRGGEAAENWREIFSHGLASAGAKAAGLASMLKSLGTSALESDTGRAGRRKVRTAYARWRGTPPEQEGWGAREFVTLGLAAAGLGAAAAYLFNPSSGPEHRRLLGLQARRVKRQAGEWAWAAADSARHLAESASETIGGRFSREDEAGEDQDDLARRVREKVSEILGANMGELDVATRSGRVTIKGHLAADRRQQVLSAVRSLEGVSEVEHSAGATRG